MFGIFANKARHDLLMLNLNYGRNQLFGNDFEQDREWMNCVCMAEIERNTFSIRRSGHTFVVVAVVV